MEPGGTVAWRELLGETEQRLAEGGIDDAALSARRIVEEASGWDGAELGIHLNEPATKRSVAHLDAMVARRLTGEPLQYVVGRWSFRTLDLMVDRRVLIPRPESEEVAGWALAEARRFEAPVVADLGTGTGAIGLSIAAELYDAVVHLTDVSADAISVARANLVGQGRVGARVLVHEGSWFDALPAELTGRLHLIVSNPPYVRDSDHLPDVVKDWEPEMALRAGADGLRDLAVIVNGAIDWLVPGGALVLEMAPDQTEPVASLCRERGYRSAEILTDLNGRARSVVARR